MDNIWSDREFGKNNSTLLKLVGEVENNFDGAIYYTDSESNIQPINISRLEKAAIGINGNDLAIFAIDKGNSGYLRVDSKIHEADEIYPYQLVEVNDNELKELLKEGHAHYLIRYRFLKLNK